MCHIYRIYSWLIWNQEQSTLSLILVSIKDYLSLGAELGIFVWGLSCDTNILVTHTHTNIYIYIYTHTHSFLFDKLYIYTPKRKIIVFSFKVMFVSNCIPKRVENISIEIIKFSKIEMIQNLEQQVWLQIYLDLSYSNPLCDN